jgi:serine/threonine protein kinase
VDDPGAIARFHREMKAIGQLNHPSVVQAYDAREVGGVHFLAMEFVDGLDLSEVVRRSEGLAIADACEATGRNPNLY